jgi:hypothetical protein
VGETFFAPGDGSPDFQIKTIGNFQSHRFHGNTPGITATLPCQDEAGNSVLRLEVEIRNDHAGAISLHRATWRLILRA